MPLTIGKKNKKASEKLPKIYEEFLTDYENIKLTKPSQIQRIKRILARFNAYLKKIEVDITDLNIVHLDNFQLDLKSRLASSTYQLYIFYIQKFLRYLYQDRGILKIDLSKLMKPNPLISPTIPPKFFKNSEINKIFDSIELSSKRDFRTYAILHLAYTFGLLPREICMITLDDINFSHGEINLRSRCSENKILLPLSDQTIKAIALYIIYARPKSDKRDLFLKQIFPNEPLSSSSVCNDLCRVLKITNPSSSSYWLRHTYAKYLFEIGASSFEIKEILGFERLKTAEQYLRIHVNLMRKVIFDETI